MVVTELYILGRCIPWDQVLPGVDPRSLTAGRAKALLRQKLWISSRGLQLLLGGWQPLPEDQRVQELYAKYEQQAAEQDGKNCTAYKALVYDSSEVAFDVDTGRLFYRTNGRPANKKLRDEEELAAVSVLDKLVLHVEVRENLQIF